MTSNYLFHGTCLKNALGIAQHGFDGIEGKQLWNVSGGANYFWSLKDICKADSESAKDYSFMPFERAVDGAETAMIQNECWTPVIFLVDAARVDYEQDLSCGNSWAMKGAVVSHEPVEVDAIKKVWVGEDFTLLGAIMAAHALSFWDSNPYSDGLDVSESLENLARALQGKVDDVFPNELIREGNWNEMTREEFLAQH